MHTPNLIAYPTHEMNAAQRAAWIAAGCPSPVKYETFREATAADGSTYLIGTELPVILRRAVEVAP